MSEMTPSQLEALSKRGSYIWKEKERKINEYGYTLGLASTTLILGKIAKKEGKLKYKNEKDKKKINHFLITGTSIEKELLSTIFHNARN